MNCSHNITVNSSPACTEHCGNIGLHTPIAVQVVVGIISCLLILASVLGNTIVCLLVYRKPQMRSAINILLANIALSDIILSFLCIPAPSIAIFGGKWLFGDVLCKVQAFLLEYSLAVTLFTIFIMSTDRYAIIVRRKDKLNVKFAKIYTVMVWTVPLVTTLPPIFGMCEYKLINNHVWCSLTITNMTYDVFFLTVKYLVNFMGPAVLTAYAFASIANAVRINSFRIHNHADTEISLSITEMSSRLGFILIPMNSKLNVDVKFKTRTYKTIMLLYFVYIVCVSPYFANQITTIATDKYYMIQDTLILWIVFTKCAINPVIYYFRIKKFQDLCNDFVPKCTYMKKNLAKLTSKSRRVDPSVFYIYDGEHSVSTTSI